MTNDRSDAEEDIFFLFCFHSDDYIELNLNKEQERPNKGWEVFPLHRPCKVCWNSIRTVKNGFLKSFYSLYQKHMSSKAAKEHSSAILPENSAVSRCNRQRDYIIRII